MQRSFDDAAITALDTLWGIQSLSDTANDIDPENDLDKESVYVVSDPGSQPFVVVIGDAKSQEGCERPGQTQWYYWKL